jgi:hypothetical protein
MRPTFDFALCAARALKGLIGGLVVGPVGGAVTHEWATALVVGAVTGVAAALAVDLDAFVKAREAWDASHR